MLVLLIIICTLLWVDLVIPKRLGRFDGFYEDRAPLDFAFIALLYNSRLLHRKCIGAIITKWWIIDHCIDFPGYKVHVKLHDINIFILDTSMIALRLDGHYPNQQKNYIYSIKKSVRHISYKTVDFNNSFLEFDTSNLFVGINALCLHLSNKEIQFIPEIIRAIKVNKLQQTPWSGHAVYFHNATIEKKRVPILHPPTRCDKHFRSYFEPHKHIMLSKDQFCVNPLGISYDRCCNNLALMVADNILIGIMAWSTGCSKEFGVDPWVFTNVGHYTSWLANNSDWATFKL